MALRLAGGPGGENKVANQFVWVDIPVTDLDRAVAFYSAVLSGPVTTQGFEGMSFALLPGGEGDVTGCLFVGEKMLPGALGPLIYLNCDGRLDEAGAAVVPAGGQILEEKHEIGPHGFRTVILDSEGNRLALHSR